jgi:hypothetical protein
MPDDLAVVQAQCEASPQRVAVHITGAWILGDNLLNELLQTQMTVRIALLMPRIAASLKRMGRRVDVVARANPWLASGILSA